MICGLTACQTTLSNQNFPTMTFKYLPPIKLVVSKIELVSNAKPSLDAPHVGHKLPVSPEKAMLQWMNDRLLVAGNKNVARLIIMRADAHEINLKLDKSITGIFKNQQSHRFEAFVEARLEILDKNNVQRAFAIGKAQQSITVSEATSLSDREKIWYNLVEKVMNNFNSIIQKNIQQKLPEYLL
jgi:hypothetical protein